MSEPTPEWTQEDEELLQLGMELSAQRESPWQPACVALAFASPIRGELRFALQQWIDLDAIKSPLLEGQLPREDELEETFAVFGLGIEGLSAEDVLQNAKAMLRVVQAGFAMALKLEQPLEPGVQYERVSDQGIGSFLAVLAFLLERCHMSLPEALACEVGRAFALLAGVRVNQGWRVVGETYGDRDVAETAPVNEEVPHA